MNVKIWIALLVLLSLKGFGQVYQSSNRFFFLAIGQVESLQGRPYRFQVSARYQPTDTTAKLQLWVRQVGQKNSDIKKKDSLIETIRPNEWRTYTVTGRIQSGTQKLYFLQTLSGNGTFLFDNFSLQVQAPDRSWQVVPVKNGDFEKSLTPLSGFGAAKGELPTGVVAALAPGKSIDQSQALRITMSGGKLVKSELPHGIPYGINEVAGNYLQLKDVKLYYETYGAGEPLLLLHGNGETIYSYHEQIATLAKHFRVIAVATRAQGQSTDTLTAKLTYELFADDMKELLDSLQLPKAHILGWSDGGNTGLLMALRHTTYVNKLVTMGANLFPTTEAVDEKILRQSERARQALIKKGDLRGARLLTLVLTEPHMSYAELAAIKAPTLVLAGEKDIIKVAHTRAIAAGIPGAQVVLLAGATHYAPQQNAALFNDTVLRFLLKK